MKNLKTILDFIPGFRSRRTFKIVIATIYYLFSFAMLTEGFSFFLFYLTLPFFIFYLVTFIKDKKNKSLTKKHVISTTLAFSLILGSFISVEIQESNNNDLKNNTAVNGASDKKASKSEKVTPTSKKSKDNKNTNKTSIADSFVKATVIKHTDGDTVTVKLENGEEHKLRFIGVDTPETVHPKKPVEFYGKEASEYTKSNLLNKTIYLEKDVSDTDRYGRMLRYIWLEKPTEINKEQIKSKMFNAMLVANGYAKISTYPPDVKYESYFLELERESREKSLGLWDENKLKEFESAQVSVDNSNSKNTTSSSNQPKPSSKTSTQQPKTNPTPIAKTQSQQSQQSNVTSSQPQQSKSTPTPTPPPQQNVGSGLVITMTGKKYHRAGCRTVKQVKQSVTAEQAQSMGYTACKVCKP